MDENVRKGVSMLIQRKLLVRTMCEDEHLNESNNSRGTNRPSDESLWNKHKKNPFLYSSIVLSIVLIVLTALCLKKNCHCDDCSPSAQQLQVSQPDVDDEKGLRFSFKTETCDRSSCFKCIDEIVPHLDPASCHEEEQTSKNKSCFRCGQKCFTDQDLLNILKAGNTTFDCEKERVEITCCLLSKMGNRGCGGNVTYTCYSEKVHKFYNKSAREPICICAAASCDRPYSQTANCTCFKTARMFCGQEQIIDCASVSVNWTECHQTISKGEAQYNCICNNVTGAGFAEDLQMCKGSNSNLTREHFNFSFLENG